MEPNVPLALRRLRHVEYFAFMSRGSFASVDDHTTSSNMMQQSINPNSIIGSPNSTTTSPSHQLQNNKSPAALFPHMDDAALLTAASLSNNSNNSTSFRSFFPYDTSCCRMEILVDHNNNNNQKTSRNGESGNNNNNGTTNTNQQHLLLYRSEPVAPTRHPRFAPISTDVRALGESLDKAIIRVLAELEDSTADGYVSVDCTPDPTTFSQNNSLATVMPTSRSRGSSMIQSATAAICTKFAADDDDDGEDLINTNVACTPMNRPKRLHQQGQKDRSSSSRLMYEFSLQFSQLEYLADGLHDAFEILRKRFAHASTNDSSTNTNNNNSMECLVVCSDGVFLGKNLTKDQQQQQDSEDSTATQLTPVQLLKRFGHEKKNENQQQQQNGDSNNNNKQPEAWDVVIQNQDADKIEAGEMKSMINSTLTMHYAEVILKRRAQLEKQRLIESMKKEMLVIGGARNDGSKNDNDDDESNNNNNTSNRMKVQLTQGYRQLELEDIQRQIETAKTQLQQQTTLTNLLDEQLKGRKLALQGRRREVEDKSKKVLMLKETSFDDLDSATKLEKQLRLCRSKVLSGMSKLFPITVNAPHSICGFNIPHNEPQNEVHACALGCIVHAVVTFCAVHGHVPLHPLLSQTSRSSVAEYVGAPPSKIFPLYSTNATEREQSLKAVTLLRRVMAHAAFAIHNQRQAPDLPFGVALQKLLFNR